MYSLQEAVRLVTSEKVKDRSEGIEQYREIFQDVQVLRDFSKGKDEEKRWLFVMQGLFTCVVFDKLACSKGAGIANAAPISLRRLKDSAQMVYWMVEKACTYFPLGVFQAVFKHLSQMLEHNGRLLEPIANDYIKALRTLLSYRPHLEHLDVGSWVYSTSLCFNILLDDDMRYDLDGTNINQLLVPMDNETTKQKSSRLLDAEVASCLHLLVSAQAAPLLGKERYGLHILDKYASFLLSFSSETTAHLPILQGLNAVLSELEVNESAFVYKFAIRTWSSLLQLWSCKSRQIKEQVIVTLKILLPSMMSKTENASEITSLYRKLLDELEQRFALAPLSINNLDLCNSDDTCAFQYPSLQLKSLSSATVIQSWAALELAADCALHLYRLESSEVEEEITERPKKRLRRDNVTDENGKVFTAIDTLIERAERKERGHESKGGQSWALQILLFASLRCGDDNQDWSQDVLGSMAELLSNEDAEVQSWSLLVIATLSPLPSAKNFVRHIWPSAVRRVMQNGTARAAAHTAQAILNSGHLQQREITAELETFLESIELQGPSHLSDSICSFLANALSFISKEAGVGKVQHCERLVTWLQGTSSLLEVASIKTGDAHFDPYKAAELLGAICSLSGSILWSREEILLPLTSIVSRMRAEKEIIPIRHFTYHKSFLSSKIKRTIQKKQSGAHRNLSLLSKRNLRPLEARCINILQKRLMALVQQTADASFASACSVEQLQNALGIAIFVLIFHSNLQINGARLHQELIKATYKLISTVLEILKNARWNVFDTASTLAILEPLIQRSSSKEKDDGGPLEAPGSQSGISVDVSSPSDKEEREVKEYWDETMKLVWSSAPPSIGACFLEMYKKLMGFQNRASTPNMITASIETDIWTDRNDRQTSRNQSESVTHGSLEEYTSRLCITATLKMCRWSNNNDFNELKGYLLSSQTCIRTVLSCGTLILTLEELHDESLFTLEELEQLLDIIGNEMVAVYKYNCNIDALILSIDFLYMTLSRWSNAKDTDIQENALALCSHFVKQILKDSFHWRVELRLSVFLEHYLKAAMIDGSPLQSVESSSLAPEAIMKKLVTLHSRAEIRLRWVACRLTARLFPIWSSFGLEALQLYSHLEATLSKDTSSVELMMTRNLSLGNALVASSECRHLVFYHLLELPMVEDEFNSYTRAVLRRSCQLLGFSSIRDFWSLFATQIVWAMVENNYNVEKIPYEILDYDSQSQMYALSFEPIASMLAAIGSQESLKQLRTLVNLEAKTEKEGMMICLPFLIATGLAIVANSNTNTKQQFKNMTDDLKNIVSIGRSKQDDKDLIQIIESSLDATLFSILRLFYESDLKGFLAFLRKTDSHCASILGKLNFESFSNQHEPCKPNSEAKQVYTSIKILESEIQGTLKAATVYNTIHRLVHLVHQERLSNDQNRHIQALKLFLAVAQREIEGNSAILRLLCHSCAIMMGQNDLVDSIWPILEWVTSLLKSAIPGLSSSLLLILRQARNFSRSDNVIIAQTGNRLSDQLGRLILQLKDVRGVKSMAIEVICAWPDEHPTSLAPKRWEIDIDKLTRALQSTLLISSPFLNRFSRALQKANRDQVLFFSSTTIWTILECLQRESFDDYEKGEITSSLAEVLYHSQGQVSAPADAESQRNLFNRNQILNAVESLDGQSMQPLQTLKSWLTWRLLLLTRVKDLNCASKAIGCIRAIFTVEPSFAGTLLKDWKEMDIDELQLVKAFPSSLLPRSKRNRNELESQEAVNCGSRYKDWLCWICELLCNLMTVKEECASIGCLSSLLGGSSTEVSFAREVFPVLLHILLRADLFITNKKQRLDTKAISRHINLILREVTTDPLVWKAVINAIVQLRHDVPTSNPLDCDRWICDLDYYMLQKRAAQCQLYAAALLFAELEREHCKEKAIQENTEERLSLQYMIYSNIDDPDSFYGITNPNLRDSFVNRLQHEGQWQRLFDFYASKQEATESASLGTLSTLLHHQGFNKLSLQLDEKQDTAYSAAWRQDQWDLPVETLQTSTSQTLYAALRAIHQENDAKAVQIVLNQAYQAEYKGIVKATMESNVGIKKCVRDLLGLHETTRWINEKFTSNIPIVGFSFDDYERLISVRLSLLRSQLKQLKAKHIGDMLDEEMIRLEGMKTTLLLNLSREARENDRVHLAVNSVTKAQEIAKEVPNLSVEEEFANLLWHLGDHATAIQALSGIVGAENTLRKGNLSIELPLALARLGQWRATARSHQPMTIKDECFRPAANMLEDARFTNDQRAKVMYQYACFAHEQYQSLIRSNEAFELASFIRYRKEEIEQIEVQIKKTQSRSATETKLHRSRERAQRLLAMDQEKLYDLDEGKRVFRKLATYMYAKTLPTTSLYDDKAVIRLMAIWFENAMDEHLNVELNGLLASIPSHKFISYVTQLSARLTNNEITESASLSQSMTCKAFNVNIRNTLERMSLDHPFHSLTSLYALSRADDDRNGRKVGSSRQSVKSARISQGNSNNVTQAQVARKDAAIHLISHVASHHSQKNRILQWKSLCDACVQWARYELQIHMADVFGPDVDPNSVRTRSHAITSKLDITKLNNLNVPILTKRVSIDLTCKYEDITTIVKYNNRFTTAGGVHLPKICECVGSDGKIYKQLFKNRDDLRQDAVMQQVFSVLNSLLTNDRDTERRKLRVRTYMVIPLGPQYGLLEYVGNTRPIQSTIIATHNKYRRPGEITPHEARLRLHRFEFKGKTRLEQAKNFDEICSVFPPTFRFHFLESHKIPLTLLTNRLNYTRSVATNSIVGHILGLGDRHVSNILLDDYTGEVIHIDFGVAFDQGKLLPIPELVPFRLTRDIVDAMGLHKVEGVYRRCCQETLRVMREGASVIETVLAVFKYDPLYDWTQNPVKVIRAQAHASQQDVITNTASMNNSTATMENAQRRVLPRMNNGGQIEEKDVAELLAERAIGTVMEKLSNTLSVDYTVNELIRQARDSGNLGSMFSGWQAAL